MCSLFLREENKAGAAIQFQLNNSFSTRLLTIITVLMTCIFIFKNLFFEKSISLQHLQRKNSIYHIIGIHVAFLLLWALLIFIYGIPVFFLIYIGDFLKFHRLHKHSYFLNSLLQLFEFIYISISYYSSRSSTNIFLLYFSCYFCVDLR